MQPLAVPRKQGDSGGWDRLVPEERGAVRWLEEQRRRRVGCMPAGGLFDLEPSQGCPRVALLTHLDAALRSGRHCNPALIVTEPAEVRKWHDRAAQRTPKLGVTGLSAQDAPALRPRIVQSLRNTAGVLICSKSILCRCAQQLQDGVWDFVIVDCSFAPSSAHAAALRGLNRGGIRFVLSEAPQGAAELRSAFQWIDENILGPQAAAAPAAPRGRGAQRRQLAAEQVAGLRDLAAPHIYTGLAGVGHAPQPQDGASPRGLVRPVLGAVAANTPPPQGGKRPSQLSPSESTGQPSSGMTALCEDLSARLRVSGTLEWGSSGDQEGPPPGGAEDEDLLEATVPVLGPPPPYSPEYEDLLEATVPVMGPPLHPMSPHLRRQFSGTPNQTHSVAGPSPGGVGWVPLATPSPQAGGGLFMQEAVIQAGPPPIRGKAAMQGGGTPSSGSLLGPRAHGSGGSSTLTAPAGCWGLQRLSGTPSPFPVPTPGAPRRGPGSDPSSGSSIGMGYADRSVIYCQRALSYTSYISAHQSRASTFSADTCHTLPEEGVLPPRASHEGPAACTPQPQDAGGPLLLGAASMRAPSSSFGPSPPAF
eukprot:TRINITY_DN12094_c0_g1_i1.p1 TRINITY_DN12094_c0_g1~~TRINITY_DN12094_c0_g1_i1.p1  ORF type:complete len:682 (+),score=176.02 TRINITY_DN12094_c0_g1_i1:282-2048(+)